MRKVENQLRVSHFAQIPCQPFTVEVESEEQAYFVSELLANQHLFLFENNIIGDYSNVISIDMWDESEQEWTDYYNEEESMDFEEFSETYLKKKL